MVQELLERGANCNIKAEVCTGLYIHVLMILMRMISSVLRTCTSVILCFQMNMTCLAWAAGRGHTDVVKILIQKGAKVNTPDKVNR